MVENGQLLRHMLGRYIHIYIYNCAAASAALRHMKQAPTVLAAYCAKPLAVKSRTKEIQTVRDWPWNTLLTTPTKDPLESRSVRHVAPPRHSYFPLRSMASWKPLCIRSAPPHG